MGKIVIIGGSGFIGKYLVRELLSKGYDVKVLDRIRPDFEVPYFEVDIMDTDRIKEHLTDVEGVIHLAAMVGVDNCRYHEEDVIRINYEGTKNVVEACLASGVKRLLFSSSSEVYGDGVKSPFEEQDAKRPKSTYGKTKLLSEEYLQSVSTVDFQVRVVRYFNVYGPHQRKDFVINRFLHAAHQGEPITIYGDGEQTRSFSYITDIVRGTILAFEHEGNSYEDFNIGNDQPITINRLAMTINTLMNNSKILHVQLGEDGVRDKNMEVYRRVPSIKKARDLLGYEPHVFLDEGLGKIIDETFKLSVS